MSAQNVRQEMSPKDVTIETEFDMIEAASGHEKRPAVAQTTDGANPNTFRKVGLMPRILSIPSDVDDDHREKIARQYLRMTAVQMQQAVQNRNLYVVLARAYGMSHQSIGDELGITEARVRQILAAE